MNPRCLLSTPLPQLRSRARFAAVVALEELHSHCDVQYARLIFVQRLHSSPVFLKRNRELSRIRAFGNFSRSISALSTERGSERRRL